MADVVLATLNAKYIHASFGLRYLRANLGELKSKSKIVEFTINERPIDIVERLLDLEPKIVGLGVYIWNAVQTLDVVKLLRAIDPAITIIIGGPEVSHEASEQSLCQLADYVIQGEGDLAFRELCEHLLRGQTPPPGVIPAVLPEIADVRFPYDEYIDDDVAHRIVYVEASRGCPFRCEFCLSSLDKSVRGFDTDAFLEEMQKLERRGVRHFKFVDRTFNLKVETSTRILSFFLENPDLIAHFEMIPDRLPEELRDVIAKFEPGRLQFEVGIQTFNPEVAKRISRRQNYDKLRDNFLFLRDQTDVHVHADLIVGLPGETLKSFGEGFDQLVELGPDEIQVGILKRLRGTPIARHTAAFEMVYESDPPYALLKSSALTFQQMQRMKRFARYWDLIANSGNFLESTPLIWGSDSPFRNFLELSDWLFDTTAATHRIALNRLVGLLFEFFTEVRGKSPREMGEVLLRDFQRPGRPSIPKALKGLGLTASPVNVKESGPLKRQQRHSS